VVRRGRLACTRAAAGTGVETGIAKSDVMEAAMLV
jgi:hypothetical protein